MDLSSLHTLIFFFFNDTATTEIYTLSLHDALPICPGCSPPPCTAWRRGTRPCADRKSTRLNSSHLVISYAVFCLKKKKTTTQPPVLTSNSRLHGYQLRHATVR